MYWLKKRVLDFLAEDARQAVKITRFAMVNLGELPKILAKKYLAPCFLYALSRCHTVAETTSSALCFGEGIELP